MNSDNDSLNSGTSHLAVGTLSPNSQEFKRVKAEIKRISEPDKMRCYMLENEEAISGISTALLNAWQQVKGYTFYRRHGIIGFCKSKETKDNQIIALTQRIDKLQLVISKLLLLTDIDPVAVGLSVN